MAISCKGQAGQDTVGGEVLSAWENIAGAGALSRAGYRRGGEAL